jgi:hypothetical protein
MGLFGFSKPKYRARDAETRLEAVEATDDQTLLAEIAKSDSSPRVRKAAVAKISDQELLISVALDGKELDARIAAVEKIDSQEKLAEIIKLRKNFQLMGACFSRITDRRILEKIAQSREYNISARRMAIENFADESYLAEMVSPAAAAEKIKSPREIDALIENYGSDRLVRALGKFRGSKNALLALGEIVRRGGDAAVTAVEYLAYSLTHASPEICRCAEEQLATITNPDLIAHLVRMMENAELQHKVLAVLRRIDHPDARQIIRLADEGPDGEPGPTAPK